MGQVVAQAKQGRRACRESYGVFRVGSEHLKCSPAPGLSSPPLIAISCISKSKSVCPVNGVRYAHQLIMHAHQSSAHARGRQCVRWRLGVCWSGMGAHMNALRLGRRGSKRWSHNASRLMHLPRVGYGRGRGERSASRWPVLKTGSEWGGDQGRVQTA